jgi:hypothetical protein
MRLLYCRFNPLIIEKAGGTGAEDTMDWTALVGEIHSLFFPTGWGTFLRLIPQEDSRDVKWEFIFLDLGMCHVISGGSRVEYTKTEGYTVDGRGVGWDLHAVWYDVFHGRHARFQRELYANLGIEKRTEREKHTARN